MTPGMTDESEAGGGETDRKSDNSLLVRLDDLLRPERLAAFSALKRELDPSGTLETDLSRRVFPA